MFGRWVARSPQYGAYSKEIDFAGGLPNAAGPADELSAAWAAPPPPPPGPGPAPPFKLGRSWAVYANETLAAWGGNALLGDDGLYHLYTSAMPGPEGHPGPCVINTWERNSAVLHAVAKSPIGPFKWSNIALEASHTNPQIMRTPDGEWLLFSCACCAKNQYHRSCSGCHKGQCGPQACEKTTPYAPLPKGKITLSRRERPKIMFDEKGVPKFLYNSGDPGPYSAATANPNKGWVNSRAFTMATEILES